MSLARIRFGLPLGGINREIRVAIPAPRNPDAWHASDIQGLRFDTGRSMRPLPTVTDFADTPDANRVTRLHNIRWGDATFDTVRHTHTGFYELSTGGVWTARNPAAGFGASTQNDYWGATLVPSTDARGHYMFSNRVVGPFTWTGTGPANNAPAGSLPARYIVAFADRAMGFNINDGGSIKARSTIWSVPGDGLTWTGTGSGNRDFTEFEGEITNVGAIRRNLYIYAESSILLGTETFNADSPVAYTPVTTDGIGCWAPNSLLSYNDIHAFLSLDGFKAFDGQQLLDIGKPIDTFLLNRITRGAVRTVCGFVKPDWHVAFWAVPVNGSLTPNEGWWFDYQRQTWHRVNLDRYYPVNPTAFTVVTGSSPPPWNDAQFVVPWTDASVAGKAWIDFAGATGFPTLVSGHQNGTTRFLDEASHTSNVEIIIETPDFTYEGTVIVDSSSGRNEDIVGPHDIVTLDEIELTYRTISGAATLFFYVSTDGGATYSAYGLTGVSGITLPAGVADQVRRLRVSGRTSGNTIRVFITNRNFSSGVVSAARIFLEDIIFTIRKVGEIRSVA